MPIGWWEVAATYRHPTTILQSSCNIYGHYVTTRCAIDVRTKNLARKLTGFFIYLVELLRLLVLSNFILRWNLDVLVLHLLDNFSWPHHSWHQIFLFWKRCLFLTFVSSESHALSCRWDRSQIQKVQLLCCSKAKFIASFLPFLSLSVPFFIFPSFAPFFWWDIVMRSW